MKVYIVKVGDRYVSRSLSGHLTTVYFATLFSRELAEEYASFWNNSVIHEIEVP